MSGEYYMLADDWDEDDIYEIGLMRKAGILVRIPNPTESDNEVDG